MKRILAVLALVLSSTFFVSPAAADTPGSQSACQHQPYQVYWGEHRWDLVGQDWHYVWGRWRHYHHWDHWQWYFGTWHYLHMSHAMCG